MRISLFVASAILLSSWNNAIAATSDKGQAKVAMVASTDVQVPARAIDTSNGKRFLRSYYKEDENDEAGDEEERVMDVKQIEKWTKRADQWVNDGYRPASLKEKLTGLRSDLTPKDREKYELFLKAWNRANPRGLD
ncbi:hypothetical protein P3T76_000809 [Phytophthora citrophthora]|uniref:RxLR effector protein n=1 Tax=Phytophthora citrophthora TaxID=4793 RepID=A0AAD9H0Q7_9STRA|nr:hypothetical protein P3T76_000809 [Phytophthora citrophthora]